MPIEALRLRRFRGFQDVQLPLLPLTILLGPNSAGKSCFGHAIVGLAQAQRRAGGSPLDLSEPNDATTQNWPVDLGQFKDLRTTDLDGPVGITMTTQFGDVELEFGDVPQVAELGVTRIRYVDNAPDTIAQPKASVGTQTIATGIAANSILVRGADHHTSEFRRSGESVWLAGEEPVDLVVNGLDVRSAYLSTSASAVSFPRGPGAFLANFLRSVRYLRATRLSPVRQYERYKRAPEDVGPSGEWTADYLASHGHVRMVEVHEAPDLAASTDAAVNALDRPWVVRERTLLDAVGLWLRHMQLAHSVSAMHATDSRLVRLDATVRAGGHSRSLTDLGFGLSQTIPVLVAGLELKKDDLLVVELPEAQLHPVPQALFADFFCSLVKRGARVLIETHSEPLFHRLRVRAAFDEDLAKKIGAWFVDAPNRETGLCSSPRSVDLDDEFSWPEGFLAEGYADEIALRAARAAKRRLAGIS